MELESFSIGPIGQLVTERRFGWVPVYVSLTDGETGAHPSIEIRVPIQYKGNWTIDQLRAVAFDKAQAVMSEVQTLMNQHGMDGLQKLSEVKS